MSDSMDMEETMKEIELNDKPVVPMNLRDNLKADILDLDHNIENAQAALDQSYTEHEPTHTPVTPEQANERKRELVFLIKDREKKQAELADLDL